MDFWHDVDPVDDNARVCRRAQRRMECGAFLGRIDRLTAEHGVPALAQSTVLGQIHQQGERVIGDAVFGIVEIQPGGVDLQPLAALRVIRKKLPQVPSADVAVMIDERLPRGTLDQRGRR